ncbi:hypothetical protein TIFTF001_039069 [Ficus carica]|uniref:Uncharacterized protein n=1 Tax=Ficus carica TaxID=3494 RepID=A0AA88JDK6_FICCA|nr:hypothetical protein TIFTF001_039069 [Ficus carica]
MPVWNLLLGSRCSEHCFVRAYGLFRREWGTWLANDSVLGKRPAIRSVFEKTSSKHCRAWSEMVFCGRSRFRYQHKPPSISGLAWSGMLV